MADFDEADILFQTQCLAHLAPARDASARAVAATRAALLAREAGRSGRWRRRLLMAASVAAVFAISIGLSTFLSSQRADAAMLLKEVAEVGQDYAGWVHVHFMTIGKDGETIDGDTMAEHLNTVTGAAAYDIQMKGVRHVLYSSPESRETRRYDSASNEIRINDVVDLISQVQAERLRNYPLSLAAAVDAAKKRASVREPTVSERTEDGLLRLDVTFPEPSPDAAANVRSASVPVSATLWADPETKLLRKSRYEDADGTVYAMTFTYGAPAVKSLYDLGVPRDAVVIDERASEELAALSGRLEQRVENGFGDGLVMLAEINRFDGDPGMIHLSLRKDGSIYSGKFLRVERPENWPNPTAAGLLSALDDANPVASVRSRVDAPPFVRALQISFNIPSQIWPTPLGLGILDVTAKWDLLTSPARPGLVGIRVVRATPDDEYRIEQTIWLDPARDDIPVESIKTNKAGGNSVIYTRIVFSDPKQTQDGQWYPSSWCKWEDFEPITEESPRWDYILRVYPGHRIDDVWFGGEPVPMAAPSATKPAAQGGGENGH